MKRLISIILCAVLVLSVMASCGSKNRCETCGATPTKAYLNEATGAKEYYCKKCSSDCAFCSKAATKYYTSLLGIVFVCKEHYDYVERINK